LSATADRYKCNRLWFGTLKRRGYAPVTLADRKPIIGIAGGIGSGKSFVADLFGQMGCQVVRADNHVHAAYNRPDVRRTLRQWWGDRAFLPDGSVHRRAVADIVFTDPAERIRLEKLIHPLVHEQRKQETARAQADPSVSAVAWDIPLLFETGLNAECDCILFVDAPREVRLSRLKGRGWTEADLVERENLQLPLDKKRALSQYYLSNADGIDVVREQARDVLSRILTDCLKSRSPR
jgi:dephospho-CoA kinase